MRRVKKEKTEVTPSETSLISALEDKEIVETNTSENLPTETVKDITTTGVNKEIQDLLGGYKESMQVDEAVNEAPKTRKGRTKKSEPEPEAEPPQLISGALLVLMIDLVFPNIIAVVNNKVSKDKIKAKDLSLKNEQKKELEPMADEVAKEIQLKMNPLVALIVTLAGIYGVNLMALKSK